MIKYIDRYYLNGEMYGIKFASPSRLPAEYQEVEYIESSWTQWIDTWVIPNQDTVSQIKVRFIAFSWNVVFGYNQSSDNDQTDYRFFTGYAYADGTIRSPWRCVFDIPINQRIETAENTFTIDTDYNLEVGNFYVKDLDTETNIWTWTPTSSFIWTTTITLDHCAANNQNSSSRWYSVVINDWVDDVLNLVPCYRKSDDVIWMYDTINNQFYTNSGSWDFTKWPNI